MNETTWPFVGSDDANARLIFSTVFVSMADDDVVTKSFFLSAIVLSIFVEYKGGDDGVRVRVMGAIWSVLVSFWLWINEFEQWNISRNSRRNNDDVAE